MNGSRRHFLVMGATAALSLGVSPALRAQEREPAVSPTEDLMREHGLLDRLLLVYEEGVRRIGAGEPLAPDAIRSAARLVRRFIEEYHERLEEQHLFPVMEQRGMAPLVKVLREQHEAGRRVTAAILADTAPERFAAARAGLAHQCGAFIRMYRPHAAREDTVLFTAFRKTLDAEAMRRLGEAFEQEEQRRFGRDGFEKIVDEVAGIERQLGIHDLARFTP